MDNGTSAARSGSGVWFGPGDRRNIAAAVPGTEHSNQRGEIYAVVLAAAKSTPFAPLHIVTDSQYVIDGLTLHLPRWEDRGWLGIANADLLRMAAAWLRQRSAPTTFRWIKGHSGDPGNDGADELARAGAEVGNPVSVLPCPKRFLREGARLAALTQRLAYCGVRIDKRKTVRRATALMVGRVIATLEQDFGVHATEMALWRAIRTRDVARNMRDFLWKALHDALRVGRFWENIPGYEQRAICATCGVTESLEHILLECSAPGQREVWNLVWAAVRERGLPQIPLSLGAILGAPLLSIAEMLEKKVKAADRFYQTIVLVSAHLIWCLRCERVIQWAGEPERRHLAVEIERKWKRIVERRVIMDLARTSGRFGKRALRRELVLATWRPMTEDRRTRRDEPGVLVGSLVQEDSAGIG
ncbi:ribonuclease H-like protein [Earliella scabrosa]|nr:ribonuclease H-like protein [Earliella scabrosa]